MMVARIQNLRAVMLPIAILIPLLILALGYGSWWYATWNDASQRLEFAQESIKRLRWILDHEADIRQSLSGNGANAALQEIYLPNSDDDSATAALQKIVTQAIDSSSGSIMSAQPLPATTENGFKVIQARFQISSTPTGLTQFLLILESTHPYIFIDSAEISAQQSNFNPDPQTAAQLPISLSIQIDVHALSRIGGNG